MICILRFASQGFQKEVEGIMDPAVGGEVLQKVEAMMSTLFISSRNAQALSHLRSAAETAALGGAYLLTGKRVPSAVILGVVLFKI